MLARITKRGKGGDVWAIIPMKGENLKGKKITKDGKDWDLIIREATRNDKVGTRTCGVVHGS